MNVSTLTQLKINGRVSTLPERITHESSTNLRRVAASQREIPDWKSSNGVLSPRPLFVLKLFGVCAGGLFSFWERELCRRRRSSIRQRGLVRFLSSQRCK